jgi:hypothetical protein
LDYNQAKNGEYVIIATKNSSGVQYAARRVESVEEEFTLSQELKEEDRFMLIRAVL